MTRCPLMTDSSSSIDDPDAADIDAGEAAAACGRGDELPYLRARESEERDAAADACCMVKDVHLELAEAYADRIKSAGS